MKSTFVSRGLRFLFQIMVICTISTFGVGKASAQEITPAAATDKTKAVGRGYIIPHIEKINGGAKVTVEIFHNQLNTSVSLYLQAAVNDGNGQQTVFNIKELSSGIADNTSDYYSRREFSLTYNELNQSIKSLVGPKATLKIGPGTPLFVFAGFETNGNYQTVLQNYKNKLQELQETLQNKNGAFDALVKQYEQGYLPAKQKLEETLQNKNGAFDALVKQYEQNYQAQIQYQEKAMVTLQNSKAIDKATADAAAAMIKSYQDNIASIQEQLKKLPETTKQNLQAQIQQHENTIKKLPEVVKQNLQAQIQQHENIIKNASPSMAIGHRWGSTQRGGQIFMPGTPVAQSSSVATTRPTELDLAFTITQTLGNIYNDRTNRSGLKVGGQIRSRVEGEGKFQIPLTKLEEIKKNLFELSKDSQKAKSVLGPDWTIQVEDRYMKKDSSGKVVMGTDGLPVPDPMVDTYYDNAKYEAAANDMAIRYRWTEGNRAGAWNFKPGIGVVTPEGIAYRVEYGIDATDNKPETIKKFVDSSDPLNPFQALAQKISGAKPSDFLQPSVEISDIRYKFKLQHTNGLIIEVSLDDVHAKSLRSSGVEARFGQMEMDIDHLATKSSNTVSMGTIGMNDGFITKEMQTILQGLTDKAFFDGRPVMHDETDLDLKTSKVLSSHKSEFDLATKVISSMRESLIGKDWLPGAQKYAIAAYELGLVREVEASTSVKKLIDRKNEIVKKDKNNNPFRPTAAGVACELIFRK